MQSRSSVYKRTKINYQTVLSTFGTYIPRSTNQHLFVLLSNAVHMAMAHAHIGLTFKLESKIPNWNATDT